MKIIEVKYKESVFIVPTQPYTSIMLYNRYGNFYAEMEGWKISSQDEYLHKERFLMHIDPGDQLQLSIKLIDPSIVLRLKQNTIKSSGTFQLTDRDVDEMKRRFYALQELLVNEGLIEL